MRTRFGKKPVNQFAVDQFQVGCFDLPGKTRIGVAELVVDGRQLFVAVLYLFDGTARSDVGNRSKSLLSPRSSCLNPWNAVLNAFHAASVFSESLPN